MPPRARSAESEISARQFFSFNSDAQYLAWADRTHKTILLGGGVGSGKTVLHPLDALERSKTETDQLHGLFCNTQKQLDDGLLVEMMKWTQRAGIGMEYDRRPPRSWFARWARDGIEIPPLPKYRGILTLSTGYHALCGTLFNQSYTQYQTIQLGSIRIEEAINVSFAAITFMLERVRCSAGSDKALCRERHRHQKVLVFNPPLGPHPWLYTYLDRLEESAKSHYDGPALPHHRDWPLLKAGVGDAILIQSRTSDNSANLNDDYEATLASNYSKDTARRRLDGEILRETIGRAYTEFDNENLGEVEYDPDRDLYVCLDFNMEPRAAVLAQPLDRLEGGVQRIGVFGEYFHAGRLSDRKFAEALMRGERGNGGDSQPEYRSPSLRGLPANWRGITNHRGAVVGFGDSVGTHRSVHSDNLESSWDIVDQVFRQHRYYRRNVPEDGNPPPRHRVDSVNGKLCNARGQRSLIIAPRCEELIRDMEQVVWDDDGVSLREWRRGSLGTEWHRTHLSDGLGYMIARLFPLGVELINRAPVLNVRPTESKLKMPRAR